MFLYKIKQSPPSVNTAFFGRKTKTPKYREFLETAAWELKTQRFNLIEGPIAVEIVLHLKNVKKSDIDNRLKVILDACTYAGLWEDDSQIYDLAVSKTKSEEDWVEIMIRNYELN